ncbi:hypothetical protein NHQ30_011291 [Ciborinia camelliae]|nr:hypothetical protein NHQ30_011291 [Ciborinia camelliae]
MKHHINPHHPCTQCLVNGNYITTPPITKACCLRDDLTRRSNYGANIWDDKHIRSLIQIVAFAPVSTAATVGNSALVWNASLYVFCATSRAKWQACMTENGNESTGHGNTLSRGGKEVSSDEAINRVRYLSSERIEKAREPTNSFGMRGQGR